MIFGLYLNKVLQNIPKTVLGWKYIVLFIGLFVLLQKEMHRIIYLQGKRWPPILDIMIIGAKPVSGFWELLLFLAHQSRRLRVSL